MFSSHIQCIANISEHYLKPGDIAVDATCGNGHDSLRLANIILSKEFLQKEQQSQQAISPRLFLCDLQQSAIEATKNKLFNALSQEQLRYIRFLHSCHSTIFDQIKRPKFVVYNLGYLPGSCNKEFTTTCQSTMQSLQAAMAALDHEGIISLTAYPGHREGLLETNMLDQYFTHLASQWDLWKYHSLSREKAPCVFFLKRKGKTLDSAWDNA